ncbi:hypothetical protein [Kamptonema formosum]|uniref:hypothetical protein n=1 Tax=Kamptonema formosum TaxID=331992 RepID=UPI0012DD0F65|nr:hypothetical protein [Oscillatoria sp. PCC 10802]
MPATTKRKAAGSMAWGGGALKGCGAGVWVRALQGPAPRGASHFCNPPHPQPLSHFEVRGEFLIFSPLSHEGRGGLGG